VNPPSDVASQPLAPQAVRSRMGDLVALFKLRVVALLLVAAVGGAVLGAGGWPGINTLGLLLVAGGISSAGASALNESLEREIDAQMRRTRQRPLVTGAIAHSGWVRPVAAAMVALPPIAVLPSNPALALFLALGALIYVGVYTLWLKPRTPLNIVIGGSAGSCTVLGGGAAVGAWADPGVLALALLVFLWTPIHFWSLARMYGDDYKQANVPMLPVVTTPRRAAFWALVHGLAAGLTALALSLHPAVGLLYPTVALTATAYFVWQGWRWWARPTERQARRVFHTSNLYLGLILLSLCLDVAWGVVGG
jgi:protoheme IX farnesyltransferase